MDTASIAEAEALLAEARERNFHLTAYHEAGHAVIASLGGIPVRGVTLYRTEESIRGVVKIPEEDSVCSLLAWNTSAKRYEFAIDVEEFEAGLRADKSEDYNIRDWYKAVRAEICHLLAGAVAEQIAGGASSLGEVIERPSFAAPRGHDMAKVAALAKVLPHEHEVFFLYKITYEAITEPDTWARVERIKDALLASGNITGSAIAAMLPEHRKGWPKIGRGAVPWAKLKKLLANVPLFPDYEDAIAVAED
mgnify:CR=1 FL=1